VITVIVVGLFWLGPPIYIIWSVFSGRPLFEMTTETITVTRPQGVLVEVGPVMILWFLILFISWAMVTGLVPRKMH